MTDGIVYSAAKPHLKGHLAVMVVCGTALIAAALILGSVAQVFAVESGQFRLLSVSDSTKMILVSQIPTKTKYILDAAAAKITVDGKPSEFENLDFYTIINVKFELKKGSKEGIETDGVATEIRIVTQENKK